MTILSRRSLLGSAAAVTATSLIAPMVQAAAPASGKQAPGFYRYKVGDYEITVVNDGVWNRKLESATVPGRPLAEVQQALADAFQPTDTLTIPFSPVVINTGTRLIAIDTNT